MAQAPAPHRRLALLAQQLSGPPRMGPQLPQQPSLLPLPSAVAAPGVAVAAAAAKPKPKLAIICTVWYYLTHAQHEGDRFNHGWPMNGQWHDPEVELVSIFCDQKKEGEAHPHEKENPNAILGDLAHLREQEWPSVTLYDTVAEALRCGGDTLAVDAVLLIGEHGDYEVDEYQMTRWPRYELFKEITAVYRQDGRTAPVFVRSHGFSLALAPARSQLAASP